MAHDHTRSRTSASRPVTAAITGFFISSAHGKRSSGVLIVAGMRSRMAAMLSSAEAAFMIGQGLDHELFRRTIELERDLAPAVADSALAAYAALLKYAGSGFVAFQVARWMVPPGGVATIFAALGKMNDL